MSVYLILQTQKLWSVVYNELEVSGSILQDEVNYAGGESAVGV